jgi:poly(3-hydroxybutyrate) depolymerase
LSIRQMVEKIVVDRGIDRQCVFITGQIKSKLNK